MTNLKKCIKKICAVSLAVLMFGGSAVTVLPEVAQSGVLASALSEGTTTDGFEWYENVGGGVTISGYNGKVVDVVIPDKIDGKVVTGINDSAFYDCTRLTSVTIPDSVTWVGRKAFYGCTGLTSVKLPDSVTEIMEGAFSGCTGLTSVDIPNSVKAIGEVGYDDDDVDGVFEGCTGLTSVTIPDSVTIIGKFAFSGCIGLTNIDIHSSVEYICEYAFSHCTKLKSVTMPDSVTLLGGYAFRGCTELTSVTISNSVTKIGDSTFSGCTGLTSIDIPDSVTYIDDGAFSDCTGLTSIDIPDSVTVIYNNSFSGCIGLTSVTIGKAVMYIGQYAFNDCTGLTSVIIPESVTEIGSGAFVGCTGLTSINVDKNNKNYTSENGVLFNKDKSVLVAYPGGKKGVYNIPGSVTKIDLNAFSDCTGLKSIEVSSGNENYSSDNGVLLDKDQKELIRCPEGFEGSYTIPDSVTEICDRAFVNCSGLTSVSIPYSVTEIDNEAFCGCTGLKSIEVSSGNENYSSDNGVLLDKDKKELIFCPEGYKGSYTIPTTVTSINEYVFRGCTGLTSVNIPDSVTSIVDDAFSGCTGLKSIEVSSSNENYSSNNGVLFDKEQEILVAFPKGCEGSYIIPTTVTSIGGYAFEGCTGLTNITIPNSVIEIGWYAFSDCTGLTSVNIPDSVTEIDDGTFCGCTGLASITIPDSVTWISWYDAFYGCNNLVIYGNKNSYAESYAMENEIPFMVLGKELKDSKTNVTVIGDIRENVELKITELNTDDVSIGTEKKVCVYYDISLTENGENVQPNGVVTVKIPYKDGGENIEVYRINDDGTTEKMQSSYDGEYVTFITDHFSKYAIVTNGGIEGDTNNDGEVNIADALMISRYDAGMVELEKSQIALSDVNGDGEVNIADALMISRFDAGLIDKI